MSSYQPARTEDLPPPGMLWAHGRIELGAYRLLLARPGETFTYDPRGTHAPDGFALGPHGTHYDNSAGCWWRLAWVEGGRAVLAGYEPMGQDTIDAEVDLLAGGPAWLPWEWLDMLIALYDRERMGVSFVYWWDGAAWDRVDYPDGIEDDGLITVAGFGTPEELFGDRTPFYSDHGLHLRRAVAGDLMRHIAEGGDDALAFELFGDLLGADRVHVDRARDLLGADWFTRRDAMPAGTPSAAPRRRRVLTGQDWDALVARAMRSATEAERPAPPETEELRTLCEGLRSLAAERGEELTFTVACEWGAVSFPEVVSASGETLEPPWEDGLLPLRLRRAETHPEHGAWYFLRARATAAGVAVERAYDHWPAWGRRSGWFPERMTPPRLPELREEMAARSPRWRPEWVRLLDEEVPYDPPTDM